MIFNKIKISKIHKVYAGLFFWTIFIVIGFIIVWPQFKNGVIIKTLKVVKVYGAPGAPGNGLPCRTSEQCQGAGNQCYFLEHVNCAGDEDCANCSQGSYSCRYTGVYGNICWGGPTYNLSQPCGRCGVPPQNGGGGGGEPTPQDCFNQMPDTPTYRYAILNPHGEEEAYISAEGYLVLSGGGNYMPAYDIFGTVDALNHGVEGDDCNNSAPVASLVIRNDQDVPVAAFYACSNNADAQINFVSNGPTYEFTPCDYNSSGYLNFVNYDCTAEEGLPQDHNFIIKNGSFNDATAAWIDNAGSLHLKACVAKP